MKSKNSGGFLLIAFLICHPYPAWLAESQAEETNQASKFPCAESEVAHYTAYHISEVVKIDGHLDEACWLAAPRSPRFIDILRQICHP